MTCRPASLTPERSAVGTADEALRLGGYFGNSPQFWLELRSRYELAVVEAERHVAIAGRVKPADAT